MDARRRATQAWGCGAVVTAAVLVRTAYLASNVPRTITEIPDDAFYYLRLASNFVRLGRWTFDGSSATSGFHLLHGYLLALADLILGEKGLDWVFMLVLVGTVASVCFGVATALLIRVAQHRLGNAAGWWVPAVMLSPIALGVSTMMMESHLVVLAAAAVVFVITVPPRTGRRPLAGLVGLGLLAATTRIDFALLPVVVWLAFKLHARTDPDGARRAWPVAIGAVAGFAVTVAHTLVVSATPLPTSVTTKLTWSAARPIAFFQILQAFDLVLLALVLASAISGIRRRRVFWLTSEPLTLSGVLAMLGYAAFYATATAGAGLWYVASQVVPITVILASVGKEVAERWGARVAAVIAAALSLGCLAPSVIGLQTMTWPWHMSLLHAARSLGADSSIEHIGAWNAGILSVVSDKTVTNLDGLVDDRAAAAASAQAKFDYLRARGIDQLADAAHHVNDGVTNADTPIARCYVPDRILSATDDPPSSNGPVWLFVYRPGCR